MGKREELDPELLRHISRLDQQPAIKARLDLLQDEVKRVGGLFVYSMERDDAIEVEIDGKSPDGVQVEEDGLIVGKLSDKRTGKIRVIADTRLEENWTGREINLGTHVKAGGIITKGGLLRGYLIPNGCVIADLAGSHFRGEDSEVKVLVAGYKRAGVNGRTLFDVTNPK